MNSANSAETVAHTPAAGSKEPYFRVLLAAFTAAYGIGLLSLIALPFVIGANIASLGLDAAQAGLLGTLEFVGVVAASMLLAPRVGHINRRTTAMIGAAIVVAANLVCSLVDSYDLLLFIRPITGIGAGLALAPGNATVATARNPERFAGHMSVLFVILMVAVMFGFAYLSENHGQTGVYLGLAATVALLAPSLVWLPAGARTAAVSNELAEAKKGIWSAGGIAVMLAVFCFSTRDTMTWAFAETTGKAAGLSPAEVGQILGIQAAIGLIGPLLASWMGSHFGLRLPLVIGILASGTATLFLSQSASDPTLFTASAMALTGTYFFTLSYLTALAAELDAEGRIVAATGSAVMAGLAVAPLIAGHMLTAGGSAAIGIAIAVLMAATLIAALVACTMRSHP